MVIKRAAWQVVAFAALLPAAGPALGATPAHPAHRAHHAASTSRTRSEGANAASGNVGVASWYGGWHDGLRTSSGETFDQDALTAASRSIPLGTRVRVTLHETGQSVVVRVNDRMGARKAIIDLSRGAAREIGLLGRGRGLVSIEAADDEPVEVAQAFDDGAPADQATDDQDALATRRRRRASPHAARVAMASHRCCRMASVVLARHVVPHHQVQRRL
jgi:rare lipoprotein A